VFVERSTTMPRDVVAEPERFDALRSAVVVVAALASRGSASRRRALTARNYC
jgi:hypothetical protein